jgi:hypothetical protein
MTCRFWNLHPSTHTSSLLRVGASGLPGVLHQECTLGSCGCWLLRAAGQKTQPHTAQHDAWPTFHGKGGASRGRLGARNVPFRGCSTPLQKPISQARAGPWTSCRFWNLHPSTHTSSLLLGWASGLPGVLHQECTLGICGCWLLRAAGQKTQPHTAQHDAWPTLHGKGGGFKGKARGEDPPLLELQHSTWKPIVPCLKGRLQGEG